MLRPDGKLVRDNHSEPMDVGEQEGVGYQVALEAGLLEGLPEGGSLQSLVALDSALGED